MQHPGPTSSSTRRSGLGLGIASLVLGLLGFCTAGLTGVVGLIIGIVALNRGGDTRGVAIGGIITSAVSLLMVPVILLGLLLPALGHARHTAQALEAQASMQQAAAIVISAAERAGGRIPEGDGWVAAVEAQDPSLLVWPGDSARSIAMNRAVAGIALDELAYPERTVLLFEVLPGSPATAGVESIPLEPRFHRSYVIATADGQVHLLPQEQLPDLLWAGGGLRGESMPPDE